MQCCSSQNEALWFTAVLNDDLEYLKANSQMLNLVDRRDTSRTNNIYQGCTALHYAILLNRPKLFTHLLKFEYAEKTVLPLVISTPLLPPHSQLQLAAGEDCLSLAIALGNEAFIEQIHEFSKFGALLNEMDDDGNTHLMIAAHFPYSLLHSQLAKIPELIEEAAVYKDKTFLLICCRLGRYQFLTEVFERLRDESLIFKQFFVVYEEKTLFDCFSSQADMQKCGFTEEQRQQCRDYVYGNLRDAYTCMLQEGYDFSSFRAVASRDVLEIIDEKIPHVQEIQLPDVAKEEVHELETESEPFEGLEIARSAVQNK